VDNFVNKEALTSGNAIFYAAPGDPPKAQANLKLFKIKHLDVIKYRRENIQQIFLLLRTSASHVNN
jgi:hypothetical protein